VKVKSGTGYTMKDCCMVEEQPMALLAVRVTVMVCTVPVRFT
jgi:hypothetical protein